MTDRSAWAEWIEYFLNGVARMSEDALSMAERINRLLAGWRQNAAGSGSGVPLAIIDRLEENPYCTIGRMAEQLDAAFTTAQRGVDKLVSLGVLKQVNAARRNRVYCAQDVMDILDEPPVLASR